MPIFRSFFSCSLDVALRAAAIRCCQCWIVLAVAVISAADARPLPNPRLVPQFRRVFEHVLDADGRAAAGDRSRRLAAASPGSPKRPLRYARLVNPAGERLRHFAHKNAACARAIPAKTRFSAVSLVERQPVESHSVVRGRGRKAPMRFSISADTPRRRECPPHGSGCGRPTNPRAETSRHPTNNGNRGGVRRDAR